VVLAGIAAGLLHHGPFVESLFGANFLHIEV